VALALLVTPSTSRSCCARLMTRLNLPPSATAELMQRRYVDEHGEEDIGRMRNAHLALSRDRMHMLLQALLRKDYLLWPRKPESEQ
jgi:hypothetical protein